MDTEVSGHKLPTSSFIHEDGIIHFNDGSSSTTEFMINVDKITMLARNGENKTMIYLVGGDYISIEKPFEVVCTFISNSCNFIGSIRL